TIAIFPMFIEAKSGFGLAERRLRFIGFNGASGPADMTEEPIYLIEPGAEELALKGLEAVVQSLSRKGAFDILDLRFWHQGEGELPVPFRHRSKKGPALVDLPETWAEYRKFLTKSMRDNLGYYPRLLQRHGHTFEIKVITGDGLHQAVTDLVALHKIRNT